MDLKQVPVDRDFTTLVICAVRYALQRRSYMPGYIVRYVTGILPVLPSETLRCLYRDIGDELGFISSTEDEEFQTL